MKKKFICTVCGYIYEGTEAPAECPVCHAKAEKFKEFDPEALKGINSLVHQVLVEKWGPIIVFLIT